ncbi:MAG: MerR family transcriptional regulator [Clostridia bacterium]|nr:MerR family transcriptional regulator [Clostridia bacterium]
MSYTIKEVAELMNVSTATLRYYDDEGLLPNIKRVNGRRVFEEEDFKWLKLLSCMKEINMPIKKIREYVQLTQQGDSTLQARFEMILQQKQIILSQVEELNKCLKVFEFKEEYYKKAIAAGSEKAVEDMMEHAPKLND